MKERGQQVSDERGTGRTTRVIDAAVLFSLRETGLLFVHCANFQEVSRLRHMFLSAGGNERTVKFVSLTEDLRGYQPTMELWDNYAIDMWERRKIEEIKTRAEGIRKCQP